MEHTFELFEQAIWIMVFGMAIVFLFLSILIFVTKLSAKIIQKLGLDQPVESTVKPQKALEKNDRKTVAAIGAAVNHYRQSSK